jgi:hypothetical protein
MPYGFVILEIIIKDPSMGMIEPEFFLQHHKIPFINETQNTHAEEGWTWKGTVSTKHFTPEFMVVLFKHVHECRNWKISLIFQAPQ